MKTSRLGVRKGTCMCVARASQLCVASARRSPPPPPPAAALGTPILAIKGMHEPKDLIQLAGKAREECEKLEWSFHDLLLSLPSSSSSANDTRNINLMLKAFQCLLEVRLVTSDVIRTSRYLIDYHQRPPPPDSITNEISNAWHAAASSSQAEMAVILQGLAEGPEVNSLIRRLREHLVTSSSSPRFSKEDQRRAKAWLRCCEVFERAVTPPPSSSSSSSQAFSKGSNIIEAPSTESSHDTSSKMHLTGRKAALAAFGVLSNHPCFQPTLLLHPLQERALSDWLDDHRPSPLPTPQELLSLCQMFGWVELSSKPLPDGSYPPAKLRVRGNRKGDDHTIDLSDLVDITEMAQGCLDKADSKGGREEAYGELAVVRLTPFVMASVLCHHPDEGLRQQIYESGLVKRKRVLLRALGVIRSHTDASHLIEGSIFAEGSNVLSFLRDLALTLRPYAESDISDLTVLQSRSNGNKPDLHNRLDVSLYGWNIDYLTTQLPRGMSEGWTGWQNHFTIGSVLTGINNVLSSFLDVSIDTRSDGFELREDAWGLRGRAIILRVHTLTLTALGHKAASQQVGTIVIHLHGTASEFPFTTLVREGLSSRSSSLSPAPSDDAGLPIAVIRIQDPCPGSSAGSLDEPLSSPFFIRALWHEMGHALHFVLSSLDPPMHPQPDSPPSSFLLPPPCLNACHSSIDIRELPSHIFELLSRNASVLQAMSCHRRFGTPLSDREARRLATSPVLSGLMASGYSTSFDLHEAVVAAMADLEISDQALGKSLDQVWYDVWGRHGVLEGRAVTIERLRHLESMSVVGGGKWVYLLSRLLAASITKRHGLVDRGDDEGEEEGQDSLRCEGGWRVIRHLLMRSGGQEDPSEVIQRLLGEDSLLPQGKRGGWLVNLDSKVFQELELLD
jgi:hypothetical protein